MRLGAVALLATLIVAGCGSGGGQRGGERGAAKPGTIAALLARRGPDVAIVSGTSDFAPGDVRLAFLVVGRDGSVVTRPRARVWVATALIAKPFATTIASLETVAARGAHPDPLDVTRLYVSHVRVPRAGKYWVLAEPVGGRPIQAVGNLLVSPHSASPPLGARAFPSRTPTLASAHGDLAQLTTRTPPDRDLLRHSIADSLAAHRRFVVVFATPKFCTSRTCGPVVDVVEGVAHRFARSGIRFIHVEIYAGNDPANGFNRWVRQWRLPTEPWVFLVGSDGLIKAKFEGSLSARELTVAIDRKLQPA